MQGIIFSIYFQGSDVLAGIGPHAGGERRGDDVSVGGPVGFGVGVGSGDSAPLGALVGCEVGAIVGDSALLGVSVGVGTQAGVGVLEGIAVLAGFTVMVGVSVCAGPKMSLRSASLPANASPATITRPTKTSTAAAMQPALSGTRRQRGAACSGRSSGSAGGGILTWRSSLHSPGASSRQARVRSRYSPGGNSGDSQSVPVTSQDRTPPSQTST